jgi:hypothetical protein
LEAGYKGQVRAIVGVKHFHRRCRTSVNDGKLTPAGRYTFQPVRPDPSGLAIDGVIIVSDRGDELRWAFTDSPAFVGAAREANANISVPSSGLFA